MITLLSRCSWSWIEVGLVVLLLAVGGEPVAAGPTIALPPAGPFAATEAEQPLRVWAYSAGPWQLGVHADIGGVVWRVGGTRRPAGAMLEQPATGENGCWQDMELGFLGSGESPGMYAAEVTVHASAEAFLILWQQDETWVLLAEGEEFTVHQNGEAWPLEAGAWSTWPVSSSQVYWQGQLLLGDEAPVEAASMGTALEGMHWFPTELQLAVGEVQTVELVMPPGSADEELVVVGSAGVELVPGSWSVAGRPVRWERQKGGWTVNAGGGGRLVGKVRGLLAWGTREWLRAAVGEHKAELNIELRRGAFGDHGTVYVEALGPERVLTPEGERWVRTGTSFVELQPGVRPWITGGDEPQIHWLHTVPGSLQSISLERTGDGVPQNYVFAFAAVGSHPGWSVQVRSQPLAVQASHDGSWEAEGSLPGGHWSLQSDGAWQWSAAVRPETEVDWGLWRWRPRDSGWRGRLAGEQSSLRLDVSAGGVENVALSYWTQKGRLTLSPQRQSVGIHLPIGFLGWTRQAQGSLLRWRWGGLDVQWSAQHWGVRGLHEGKPGTVRWQLAGGHEGWDWFSQWNTDAQQLTLELSQTQSWSARCRWMGVWAEGAHGLSASVQGMLVDQLPMLEAVKQWHWHWTDAVSLVVRSMHQWSDGLQHAGSIHLTAAPFPWAMGSVGWDSRRGWMWQAAVVQAAF